MESSLTSHAFNPPQPGLPPSSARESSLSSHGIQSKLRRSLAKSNLISNAHGWHRTKLLSHPGLQILSKPSLGRFLPEAPRNLSACVWPPLNRRSASRFTLPGRPSDAIYKYTVVLLLQPSCRLLLILVYESNVLVQREVVRYALFPATCMVDAAARVPEAQRTGKLSASYQQATAPKPTRTSSGSTTT